MKKIFLASLLLFAGILTSCIKQNIVKKSFDDVFLNAMNIQKDIGTAD